MHVDNQVGIMRLLNPNAARLAEHAPRLPVHATRHAMQYFVFAERVQHRRQTAKTLLDQALVELSGGELQRVAITACLSRKADLYLLDEPSAHLDVEQRMISAKVMRRFAESSEKTVLVADHDIYLIDLLSERLIVFDGQPGVLGIANKPSEMREGMNSFLKNIGITFRRDEETHRPRVNKPGSRLERLQKGLGEYYYQVEESQ